MFKSPSTPDHTGQPIRRFGVMDSQWNYRLRPGAYALVTAPARKMFIVKHKGCFYLPGGGIDPGETPEIALQREFLEETGHTIKNAKMFRQMQHVSRRYRRQRLYLKHEYIFTAELDQHISKPQELGHTLHWVSPYDACTLLEEAAQHWAVAQLFHFEDRNA
jgi:8-oxo-dGTP diphosphatase